MTAGVALRTAARHVTRALSGGRSAGFFRRSLGSAAVPVTALARAARWVAALGDSRPRLLGRSLWGGSLAALTSARPVRKQGEDESRTHRQGLRPRSRETREPGAVPATAGRRSPRVRAAGRSAHGVLKAPGLRPGGWSGPADRPTASPARSAARRVERTTLARLAGSPRPVASGPGAVPRPRRARFLPVPGRSGRGSGPRPDVAPLPPGEGATTWRRSLEQRTRRRLAAAVAGEYGTRGPEPDTSSSTATTSREAVWSVPVAGTAVRTEMLLRLVEAGGGETRETDRESPHAATPVGGHPEGTSPARRIREPSGGGPPSLEGKAPTEEPPAGTSSRVPLSTWPWNRKAASASVEDRRLDSDLSPELPRQTAEGPEAAAGEGEAPRLFDRSPAEPREDDLERLARGLERLLGDEARRFGIDV